MKKITGRESACARHALLCSALLTITGALGSVAACSSDSSAPGASDGGGAGNAGAAQGGADHTGDAGAAARGDAGDANAAGDTGDAGAAGGPGDTGDTGDGGDGGSGSGTPSRAVIDYFDSLPGWGIVPPTSDTAGAPLTVLRDLKNASGTTTFECTVVTHDIVEKHDEILNFDSGAEYVKPGVLLAGNQFKTGNLEPIPLERAPIKLSINVPGVKQATVLVEDPNVSNIQQGVATLQAGAQASAAGSYAAQLSYEQHSVQSVQQMSFQIGVAAGFDGLFTSVNFSSKFSDQETTEKYTVVAKLMQQMYTVTFAQDDFASPGAFFSPTLDLADVKKAEKSGFFGPGNPPVFIGSVTYGRMVVFSATSTQVSSSQELEATLQASGSNWSAKGDLTAAQKSFLNSLDIQVLSVGGDQAKVTNAIKSGNWSDLYSGADILSSVPLRYTVHALTGTRPIAAIGDSTKFDVANCSALKGWYQVPGPTGVTFNDVSTNPNNNRVVAIGYNGSSGKYALYKRDGEQFALLNEFDGGKLLDVTVDDNNNTFLLKARTGMTPMLSRAPAGSDQFTNGSSSGTFAGIDAAGDNWIIGLSEAYDDNQRDMYTQTWPGNWAYKVDEAQGYVPNGSAGPWFSVAGNQYYYVYNGGPQIEARTDNNIITVITANHTEVAKVAQLSVASANSISALLKSGQIGTYDKASDQFKSLIDPPTGKTIKQIEATSGGFWAITLDGAMYRYVL